MGRTPKPPRRASTGGSSRSAGRRRARRSRSSTHHHHSQAGLDAGAADPTARERSGPHGEPPRPRGAGLPEKLSGWCAHSGKRREELPGRGLVAVSLCHDEKSTEGLSGCLELLDLARPPLESPAAEVVLSQGGESSREHPRVCTPRPGVPLAGWSAASQRRNTAPRVRRRLSRACACRRPERERSPGWVTAGFRREPAGADRRECVFASLAGRTG